MGPAPWWGTLLVGVLTVSGAVSGSFYAARTGARQTGQATDQRENASAREEWFKRFQWATELTLRAGDADKAAGFAVLSALASSELARADDLKLLTAVNANEGLDELEGDYRKEVDDTEFFQDGDREADNEIEPAAPTEEDLDDDE